MSASYMGHLALIKCDMCGKEYIPAACSIYKVVFAGKTHHFCSWTCYNEACKVKEKHKSFPYLKDRKEVENENNQETRGGVGDNHSGDVS